MTPRDLTPEECEAIRLRYRNAAMRFPGQTLRRDLYRLLSYVYSSPKFTELSTPGDVHPLQLLRDEHERPEIVRILLSCASSLRFLGFGHADDVRASQKLLDKHSVGLLYRNVSVVTSEPLSMREACNKILHAKSIVLGEGGDEHYRRAVPHEIDLYATHNGQSGWKAALNILEFVDVGAAIAEPFG